MKRRGVLGIALWAGLQGAALFAAEPAAPTLTLTMLPVGVGDAILISVADRGDPWRLLWDGGPASSAKATLKYLKANNIRKFDALMLSQQTPHHFEALEKIFSFAQPLVFYWARLVDPDMDFYILREALETMEVKGFEVKRGDVIPAVGDLKITILHPPFAKDTPLTGAIAALFSFQGVNLLLSGDLPPKEQREVADLLLQRKVKPDFVLWPGHGAAVDASYETLFKAASAVGLNVGKNKDGLPKPNVFLADPRVLRTDRSKEPIVLKVIDGKLYAQP